VISIFHVSARHYTWLTVVPLSADFWVHI